MRNMRTMLLTALIVLFGLSMVPAQARYGKKKAAPEMMGQKVAGKTKKVKKVKKKKVKKTKKKKVRKKKKKKIKCKVCGKKYRKGKKHTHKKKKVRKKKVKKTKNKKVEQKKVKKKKKKRYKKPGKHKMCGACGMMKSKCTCGKKMGYKSCKMGGCGCKK